MKITKHASRAADLRLEILYLSGLFSVFSAEDLPYIHISNSEYILHIVTG
jgi:hypothetical protein